LTRVAEAGVVDAAIDGKGMCASNFFLMQKALLEYAGRNGSYLPTNLMALEPFLADPTRLICPADKLHPKPASTNWSDFRADMITYKIPPQWIAMSEPHKAYLRCIVHQNVILNKGEVGIYGGE